MPDQQTTTVNRKWLTKMVIFMVVCFAFGTWGLIDAIKIYPDRGIEDASYKQRELLRTADTAGRLETARFPDPRAALADLQARRDKIEADYKRFLDAQSIATQNTPQGQSAARDLRTLAPAAVDKSALAWLESLALVGRLKPEFTNPADPRAELNTLNDKWKAQEPPKPLAVYDLPLQWFFCAVGYGLALYLIILIIRVRATVYRWEPDTQRLHLPGGRSIVPADLADLDKRKWDKFFVFLQFKDGSPELKLDLLRWVPLEEWILTMEKTAFPERAAEAAKAEADATAAAEAAAAATAAPADKPAS
jgi:hypothetical protein